MTRKHYFECVKETRIPTIPTETIVSKDTFWEIVDNREGHVTLFEVGNPNNQHEVRITKFRRNFKHRVKETEE